MVSNIDQKHGIKIDGHKLTLRFNEMVPQLQQVIIRSYYFARASDEIVLIRTRGATSSESILVLNISQSLVTLFHGKVNVLITAGSTVEVLSVDPKNTTDFYIELPLNGPMQSILPPLLSPDIPQNCYDFQVIQTNTSNLFRAKFDASFPALGKSWKVDFGLSTVHADVLVIRNLSVVRIKNLSKSNEIQLLGPFKTDDHKIKPGDMAVLDPFKPEQTAGWYVKVSDGTIIGLAQVLKSLYN